MISRALKTALFLLFIGALPAAALADDLAVGDPIKPFRLRSVNPKVAGKGFFGLSSHVGPGATEPKKAVLLSFFATYCKPCKKEMPFLAALDATYREKGLLVLSVSIDQEKEKIDQAKRLADEHGVKFPVLSDRFNIVAKRWGIAKLPCVYLIDGDGKVIMQKVGYKGGVTAELHAAVREALGEPSDTPVPPALAEWVEE
jgi:peroxiredoxin